MGFDVVEGALTARARVPGAVAAQGYRSGSPKERAGELMSLFLDPSVRAIISTIGGANSSSLLPYLDFDAIRANPKVFCGYSDVTSLHLAIWTKAGLSTFYGPAVVPSFGEFPAGFAVTWESFLDATVRHRVGSRRLVAPARWSRFAPRFNDPRSSIPSERRWQDNEGWRVVVPGCATAPVICANLNTLVSIAGTQYEPDLTGHILLIEEMAAPLSRYERNLRHLQLLGVFDRIAGLLIGKPEAPDLEGAPFTAEELLREVIGPVRYPVVMDIDVGHTHPSLTLALGTPIEVQATGESAHITVLEPMVDL